MGSKSVMLRGKLGELLLAEVERVDHFVDLFAGSGAVAHFVAERAAVPVTSYDLQEYSRVFAAAITERQRPLRPLPLVKSWFANARSHVSMQRASEGWDRSEPLSATVIARERERSKKVSSGFVAKHYGGHYFSFEQAAALDALYASLPDPGGRTRALALAALIAAASSAAASPGHTAQPFQPSESLLPHIESAWKRSVFDEAEAQLIAWAPRHALVTGKAKVGDALASARRVPRGALVFCDPPYSAAQYSRFYHVLEGVARGGWPSVDGAGRAPLIGARARSDFSMRTTAAKAMEALLADLRSRDATVVITFPDADASNGLSGKAIAAMAADDWHVSVQRVAASHSTLGGTSKESTRGGRREVNEAVITLRPRS